MNTFKHFKEIATNATIVLKKYWLFKKNLKNYLETRYFEEKDIQKIEKELYLNFKIDVHNEYYLNEEDSKVLIKLLMIEGFYNNSELFKKFRVKYPDFNLAKDGKEVIFFSKTVNELIKHINYEDLEKNISLVNDINMNLLVLEKAYLENNHKLYEFIHPLIDWDKDQKVIKKSILSMLMRNGVKIEKLYYANHIRKYINEKDVIDFFINDNLFIDNKIANNINTFFNMDIVHQLINIEENSKKLNAYSFRYSEKEFKNIANKIDRNKDYSFIIKNYLADNLTKMEIKSKIIFLMKENLLTEEVWEKIIDKENIKILHLIFSERKELLKYIGTEKIEKMIEKYKKSLIEKSYDKDLVTDFFEQCNANLSEEEFLSLLKKRDYYVEHIKENKLNKTVQKEINFINLLFEKYPEYMTSKKTIDEVIGYTKNSVFQKNYTEKLSKHISHKQWEDVIKNGSIQLLKKLFEKDELDFLSVENKEILFKEYKKLVVSLVIENKEIIKFIEKLPHYVDEELILSILNGNNQYIKMYSEIENKAINLVKEKYQNEISMKNMTPFTEFNEFYTKEEKSLIDTLFEKYPQILNSENTLLNVVKNSESDICLSNYLKKYFQINQDENLKKSIVRNIMIFEKSFFGKTLEWVIDNNLLEELFPKNELVDSYNNVFKNESWNIWAPLLIERFEVKPDVLIKQSVASFLSNTEIFKFILNHYELKPKTEQTICNSVFAIDSVELAKEIFKHGIAPNEYYVEKFKNSPTNAGDILLKSNLKLNLEGELSNHSTLLKKVKKI